MSEPARVRIVVRPYASALPMGCFAFAAGNALSGLFALHLIPAAEATQLAVILLAFVAPLELIPCGMAFLSRDTGAATVMGIFSMSWIVQGIQMSIVGGPATSMATGFLLVLLASYLAILAAVTFSGKPMIGAMLVVACVRSIAASAIQFGLNGATEIVAGVGGLVIAALAIVGGIGFLREERAHRALPMTLRRGAAADALGGDLDKQLASLSREAGVREQL